MNFNTDTLAKFRKELGRPAKPVSTLMTPGEVAKLFRVDPKTVTRWAAAGKLRHTRTPGGHVRFYRDEIMEMVEGTSDVA
jgi:excisionase family DNA binding protein